MTGAAPARIEARGWGWRHAARRGWALRDLDLVIEPGERVLLLGASGAGKSTLLRALVGVLGDDEGEAVGALLVGGVPAADARGRTGLVLQSPEANTVLERVGDDVAFGCENLGVPREVIWPRVADALAAVGLDVPQGHSTGALSGGQRQRLALAGVLAMAPGVVLLDEPTANLDPDGVAEVRDAVLAAVARTGATLVVVEHRVGVWADHVDRIVVLEPGGGVAASGPPAAVLRAEGSTLAASGVWVPGLVPRAPRAARAAGEPLLTADALLVGRHRVALRPPADLTVCAGGALALTGPNGSGKSTTALTIAGLMPPLGGALRATERLAGGLGADPLRWRSRDLVRRIGSVFQEPAHQFVTASVRAELGVGPRVARLPDAAERVDELLDRLALHHLAEANPFTLSGGEQRRLSVATALAARPRVLVADEPTFGQDARTWAVLADLFGELLDEGTALVAATHDLDFVQALGAGVYDFGAVPA